MTTKSASPNRERRLAELARRQRGVVSRVQLLELGVGPQGLVERVRNGRLHRLHRGVYAVGHVALRDEGYWIAAVLACGPGAVLSHRSAAALWELRGSQASATDVTVPSQNGRKRRRGIRIHRTRRLPGCEVTMRGGVPVTTVARTLLDLADVLPAQTLKRTVDEAEYRRRFDLTALRAAVERNPGRRGARVLTLAAEPLAPTRSELEDRLLALCRGHGLPMPRVDARVEGFEVDLHWPDARLVVELDGLAAHRTRRAMERDRLRDRRLLLAGQRTVRLTARALRDPGTVAAELRALREGVSARPGRAARSP